MALTLGNIGRIIFIGVVVFGLTFLISAGLFSEMRKVMCTTIIVDAIVIIIMIISFSWYNTSTASGIRSYKDWNSELSNGIEREITITAEDGREIFHYEGKVDIESNHEDNYIKFEGEDGKRYIIYYGIQDTIKIIEK